MGTSLKGKNLLPEGANSFPKEQFIIVWNHIRWTPLNVTIFISHVRSCIMRATSVWLFCAYKWLKEAVRSEHYILIIEQSQNGMHIHRRRQYSILAAYPGSYSSVACCTLPDKRCLSHGMCLYQVIFVRGRQWRWINTKIDSYVIIASLKSESTWWADK